MFLNFIFFICLPAIVLWSSLLCHSLVLVFFGRLCLPFTFSRKGAKSYTQRRPKYCLCFYRNVIFFFASFACAMQVLSMMEKKVAKKKLLALRQRCSGGVVKPLYAAVSVRKRW